MLKLVTPEDCGAPAVENIGHLVDGEKLLKMATPESVKNGDPCLKMLKMVTPQNAKNGDP